MKDIDQFQGQSGQASQASNQQAPEMWHFCPRDGKALEEGWKNCPMCGIVVGYLVNPMQFGYGILGIGQYQGLGGSALKQEGNLYSTQDYMKQNGNLQT